MNTQLPVGHKHSKEYTEADKIIRYLTNPQGDVALSPREKARLDRCKKAWNLMLNYRSKKDVVSILIATAPEPIGTAHAYGIIQDAEQIFGKIGEAHKAAERVKMIEWSTKNVEIAMQDGNTKNITMALNTHYKILGFENYVPDMPNWEDLQAHQYIINLPASVLSAFKHMLDKGLVRVQEILPPPDIDSSSYEEAQEVKDDAGQAT